MSLVKEKIQKFKKEMSQRLKTKLTKTEYKKRKRRSPAPSKSSDISFPPTPLPISPKRLISPLIEPKLLYPELPSPLSVVQVRDLILMKLPEVVKF